MIPIKIQIFCAQLLGLILMCICTDCAIAQDSSGNSIGVQEDAINGLSGGTNGPIGNLSYTFSGRWGGSASVDVDSSLDQSNTNIDFAAIQQAAQSGAPKYYEWYSAFGLMVTLVWLYIEIVRLLAMIAMYTRDE